MNRRTPLFVLLVAATYASAQPGRQSVESIDMMALNAQSVFVGRVSRVVLDDRDINFPFDVTFTVSEVLKGNTIGDEATVRFYFAGLDVKGWSERHPKMLVFVQSGGRQYANIPYDLEGKPISAVLTANLKVLRSGQQILMYVRDLLKRKQNVTAIAGFPLSSEAMESSLWLNPNYGLWDGLVVVPVDSDLEELAKGLLRSEMIWVRSHGIDALAMFPSKENIALLKSFLRDPLFEVTASNKDGWVIETRNYTVRRRAYEVLKVWGVKVKEPETTKVGVTRRGGESEYGAGRGSPRPSFSPSDASLLVPDFSSDPCGFSLPGCDLPSAPCDLSMSRCGSSNDHCDFSKRPCDSPNDLCDLSYLTCWQSLFTFWKPAERVWASASLFRELQAGTWPVRARVGLAATAQGFALPLPWCRLWPFTFWR